MYSSPLSEESSRVEWKEWRRKGRKRNERKRDGVEEEGKGIVRRDTRKWKEGRDDYRRGRTDHKKEEEDGNQR